MPFSRARICCFNPFRATPRLRYRDGMPTTRRRRSWSPCSRNGRKPGRTPDVHREQAVPTWLRTGPGRKSAAQEGIVRLGAENLNRLLGLASESLVESRWLKPFSDSMQRLKRLQAELGASLESLRDEMEDLPVEERTRLHFVDALRKASACQEFLAGRLDDLDMFDRRSSQLSHRLYLEALRTRLRRWRGYAASRGWFAIRLTPGKKREARNHR